MNNEMENEKLFYFILIGSGDLFKMSTVNGNDKT